jgi:hypothetical protein
MKHADMFPGRFLRADDLNERGTTVTIARVDLVNVGGTKKPVVYFAGKERGMVLNKTNAAAITEITGEPDTDMWAGRRVRLTAQEVDFQGKRVPAIRVVTPDTP